MNWQTTSEAFKDLGDVYVNSVTNVGQKQAELMGLYLETMAKYLNRVKEAKKPEELITVQLSTFSELQEKLKNNIIDTMGVFNSLNSAIESWSQKSLEVIAASDS